MLGKNQYQTDGQFQQRPDTPIAQRIEVLEPFSMRQPLIPRWLALQLPLRTKQSPKLREILAITYNFAINLLTTDYKMFEKPI